MLLAGAAMMMFGLAGAQNSATIRSRSSLAVASSANMERIPPARGLNAMDAKFMHDIAIGHMAEIHMGMIAARKGGDWARGFGKDMIREHTLALEELKKLAREKGYSLPRDVDAKHRQMERMFANMGSDFDQAYRRHMIMDHKEALGLVQSEMRNGRDAMTRGYAVTLETGVKMHLRMAQEQTTMMGSANG